MSCVTIVLKSHQLAISQKNKVKWGCTNNVNLANAASVHTATRSKETKK